MDGYVAWNVSEFIVGHKNVARNDGSVPVLNWFPEFVAKIEW